VKFKAIQQKYEQEMKAMREEMEDRFRELHIHSSKGEVIGG